MDGAKPGHTVEFQGLKGAGHLNGTQGSLIKYYRNGECAGRWAVRCEVDNNKVTAKPENLNLVGVSIKQTQNANPPFARVSNGAGAPFAGSPSVSDWARGLSKADQLEWFSNCYQMRCADDFQWGGGYLHGAHDPEATAKAIAVDFMTFCLLAKRQKVIPGDWDWPSFLKVAAGYVAFAFEKSDAKQRWGSENVFEASMGGRSLRYTGIQIYLSPVDQPGESEEAHSAEREVRASEANVQNEIGGGAVAWGRFLKDLEGNRRFA